MSTVGELIDELKRFHPAALVTVDVDLSVCLAFRNEERNFEVDTVEPAGGMVQITLGKGKDDLSKM